MSTYYAGVIVCMTSTLLLSLATDALAATQPLTDAGERFQETGGWSALSRATLAVGALGTLIVPALHVHLIPFLMPQAYAQALRGWVPVGSVLTVALAVTRKVTAPALRRTVAAGALLVMLGAAV